ncbi:MAG: hypothetical protein ACI909_002977, partial [Planctomycetota bacterium]
NVGFVAGSNSFDRGGPGNGMRPNEFGPTRALPEQIGPVMWALLQG